MAKYRNLQTSFWQNNFILELTPEEKFFYIYLMTNINTTQCGIYTFNIKLSEFETGYNSETIEKLLSRFIEYGKIKYCKAIREIMIVNWLTYNFINNKPVISCINKELHEVKNKDFIRELYVYCRNMKLPCQQIFNGLEAVYLEPANCCNTVYIGYGEEEEKEVEKEVEVEKNKEIANGENEEAIEEIGENEETAEKQIETVEEYIGVSEEQTAETEEQIEVAAGKITKVSKKDIKVVVKVFNNNIHPMTPLEYEKLSFWCQLMKGEVVIAAIEEAVKHNVRKMAYIEGVFRSWEDNGFKTLEHIEACSKLAGSPFMVFDKIFTLKGIKEKCKRLKLQGGLQAVFIDYLQLIDSGEKTENRTQDISKISRSLKLMAKELDITVIALSQLSRGPETRADHKPLLSDLRESGAIEQDADIVILLFRDEYYHSDSSHPKTVDYIVAKNRNGEVGTARLNWRGECQKVG